MRVRGICNSDEGEMQSAYIALNAAVCFCADNHCINYVDLYSEGVICQTGTVAGGFSTASNQTSTVVDFGPNNANSRHTVYWDRGQYDPRTGGKLKTIPDGELASVRLGNWLKGAEAERITYEYYVDPNTDVILLMKYAIVLEKPAPTHQAPAFEFKILDQNGNAISSCVEANFTPHDEYIEWNNYTPDFRSGFDEIVWKDWSSIGVDLRNYKGQTIGIFYKQDDAYSKGIFDQFKANLDPSIKTVEALFTDANATDFVAQIGELKACKFIFMPIYYTPASIFMTQAKDIMAADTIYYGCDGFDGIEGADGFKIEEIPQEITMLSHFNSKATDGLAKEYVDKYTKAYKDAPLNQFGASAYDCVYAIFNAMKEAIDEGKEIPVTISASDLSDILKAKFTGGFTFTGVTGENIKWQSNGYVSKDAVKYVIK